MKKILIAFIAFFAFFAVLILGINYSNADQGQAEREGVSTVINPARLNDIMDWVNNSQFDLKNGLENTEKSPIANQEVSYVNLLNKLTSTNAKPNELLMRNVLERTKVVYDDILKNTSPSPKRNALARRILDDGLHWAESLYQPDRTLLELAHQKRLPWELHGVKFASLGYDWAAYMMKLYSDAPTNATRLILIKDAMGLMFNDINNDDAVRRILAPVSGGIVSKNDEVQKRMSVAMTPLEKLDLSRDLYRFMEQYMKASKELLDTYRVRYSE